MTDPFPLVLGLPAAVAAAIYFLRSVRVINQWEVALKFTLGKLTGKVSPGLRFVAPGLQKLVRVDTRVRNRDLPMLRAGVPKATVEEHR